MPCAFGVWHETLPRKDAPGGKQHSVSTSGVWRVNGPLTLLLVVCGATEALSGGGLGRAYACLSPYDTNGGVFSPAKKRSCPACSATSAY